MDDILKKIRKYVDPHFSINQALDFGCGVGRLLIPLSVYSSHVTGVDVSESMLDEARKNCEARQITNVDFIKSDDDLSLLNRKFNFIHSYIVFQHIPAKRGVQIFKKMLAHLKNEGVGVLHFTYL